MFPKNEVLAQNNVARERDEDNCAVMTTIRVIAKYERRIFDS